MSAHLLVLFLVSAAYCAIAGALFRAVFRSIREHAEAGDVALAILLEHDPAHVVAVFAVICFFWPATITIAVLRARQDGRRDATRKKR